MARGHDDDRPPFRLHDQFGLAESRSHREPVAGGDAARRRDPDPANDKPDAASYADPEPNACAVAGLAWV